MDLNKINWKLLFLIALIKLLGFIFLISINKAYNPEVFEGISIYNGDTESYIEPIENYIKHGSYTWLNEAPNIYRSPYYGTIYYSFRQLLTPFQSLQAIAVFQLFMEIISFYCFALLVKQFIKSRNGWGAYILLLTISLYHTDFSYRILTESLSLSFLLISIYFFYRFINEKKKRYLLCTGILFGYVVLLKPYFGVYYIIFGLSFLYIDYGKTWVNYFNKVIINSAILFLPFIVLDTPWLIRNYKELNIFQPFNDPKIDEVSLSFRNFIMSRGESFIYWDQYTAGCYFVISNQPCNFELTENFISKNSSIKEIESLRSQYINYQLHPTKKQGQELIKEFNRHTENYKKDKPINHYFLSRIRMTKLFLIHSGTHYLPFKFNGSSFILKVVKAGQSILYLLTISVGLIGLILLWLNNKKHGYAFAVPFFLILFFPLFFGATETRYYFHAYPFAILGISYIIEKLIPHFKNR